MLIKDVSEYALVTLESAELEINVGVDETNDLKQTQLINIVNSVSSWFESICGREFISREHTEYYDGNSESWMYLPNRPITSISGIWISYNRDFDDDALVDSDDYYISQDTDRIILLPDATQRYFTKGVENIKHIYTGGYIREGVNANVPYDLRKAVLKQSAAAFKLLSLPHVRSKTFETGSQEFYTGALLPDVKDILSKYIIPMVY
jgi:hypothetical protein